MALQPSLDDRQKVLRWLDHGSELAGRRYGERADPRKVIWLLLSDSLDLLDRVPDQEKSWLSSGSRSGGWGGTGLTRAEMEEIERLRVMSGVTLPNTAPRYHPQRNDLERSLGVIEWLRWCSVGDDHTLQKAAILLAKGAEDAAVRVWPKSRGRVRQAVYEIRTQVVGRILSGLKANGFVPAPGTFHFMEVPMRTSTPEALRA